MKEILCLTILVETSPQALPLGAACIASAIKNHAALKNYKVSLEAFSVEDKELAEKSEDERADLLAEKILSLHKDLSALLFSVYVWNRKILEKLALILKEKNPSIITIAGGPEVTANPLSFSSFDYLSAGAGEVSSPALLARLLENQEYEDKSPEENPQGFAFGIQGIYENPYLNKSEKNSSDLQTNFTAESLLGHRALSVKMPLVVRSKNPDPAELSSPYLDATLDPQKYGGVLWELARGCPFKCSYCYESKGEKRIQYFPKERLLKELEYFAEKKIPQVFVLDPTYNADKKRALEMLKTIKKIAPDMFFYFEARAEFIDRELARAFAEINCSLQFGLQSADVEVLKKVNRTFDKKLFVRNIGFLNQAGAVFGFDLIYGLPGDTFNGFKNSIDFAMSLYPNNLELFCLSVLPGTQLYEEAESLGLTWQAIPPYHVVDSVSFPGPELKRADSLAAACDFFYNCGRAVPWFNSVARSLHLKASAIFGEFAVWAEKMKIDLKKTPADNDFILKCQLDFLQEAYKKRNQQKSFFLAKDLLLLNGAISEATASGRESTVKLTYHPDDLMSEYSQDFSFFLKNARPFNCRVKVFCGKNGVDYKVLK